MSKIKRITVIGILMLAILLLGQSFMQVEGKTGETAYFNLHTLLYEKFLCAEKEQHLYDYYSAKYTNIAEIKIVGNKSTGNGKTVEKWHNAKLQYILTEGEKGNWTTVNDVYKSDIQNAIWNCLRGWINEVGIQYGIPKDFVSNSPGKYTPELQTDAEKYADTYKDSETVDKTNKDKLAVTSYKENNQVYLRVGPFKYEFSGKLSGIDIITDKNTKASIAKLEKKVNTNTYQSYSNISDVKSGNEFYVSIKVPTDGSTKIKSVKIANTTTKRSVTIKFWKCAEEQYQNLIEYTPGTSEEKREYEFNYDKTYFGHLKVIKVDEKHQEVKLANVTFYIKNKNIDSYVKQENGKVSYVGKDKATLFKTDSKGEISIKNLIPGTYVAYEDKNPNYGYVISKDGKEKNVVIDKTAELKIPNKKTVGNLKVIKVDKNNTKKKLAGVGFYIRNEETKKYVKLEGKNKEVKYVDNQKDATEFITDKNGEFTVKDLIVGTYKAYETKNPNYGYKISKDGFATNVEIDKTKELEAPNEPELIKLSGYVWKDNQSGKQSVRNNLYKDNDYDNNDELLKDIIVRLKYNNKVVAETKTNQNGAYTFKDVEVEKLAGYTIEFEYSGLTYSNVIPHLDKDNGSKAVEGNARTTFNNKFNEITKDTKIEGTSLEYSYKDHKSTLTNGDKFKITSTTSEAGLNIKDKYTSGMTEIKNINLGLYEREMPDLSVVKDIDNVIITVNGYEHMYKYASRFVNGGEYSDGFNAGVKFGEKYGSQTYSRAVYKSDYDYKNESDKTKELKAYITYKIAIKNEATSLTAIVNNMVDYYDSRYILVAVGTEVGEDGKIKGSSIAHTDESYNDKYKKTVITTNTTIDPQKEKYIYVQFSLDKESIGSIMFDANGEKIKDKILLDNVVEINSYATYYDGALYAGIDKDSRPGNAIPGNRDTYEDDTDAAPALILELANARKIAGTVFLDKTDAQLKVGEERLGDGVYTDGEETIEGVTVKLVKEDGTVEMSTKTKEDGSFELSGFKPGKYYIVYTWEDKTYTVIDYKGTIYKEEGRQTDSKWYAKNIDTRYSDAIDNYDIRTQIDSGEHPEITTMDSTTPLMEFGIELSNENITSGIDKIEFLVKNVDFGIVERARQQLDISKNATAVKITLANGQTVVDAKIENGELKGTATKGVTYEPVSDKNLYGFIKSEIDSELIQGATVQIEYTINVKNNSEITYDSEEYYKYGTKKGNIVTITPKGVYDYLGGGQVLDTAKQEENVGWEIKTSEQYSTEVTEPIVDKYIVEYSSTTTDEKGFIKQLKGYESFYEDYSEEIKTATTEILKRIRETQSADKTILHNANLEKELKPGESNTVNLYTSKLLANSDEIDLNNSVEITKVESNSKGIRRITPRTSRLYDNAERVMITPPTGENRDYALTIVLGLSTLIILGAGVVLIKKKVLNK